MIGIFKFVAEDSDESGVYSAAADTVNSILKKSADYYADVISVQVGEPKLSITGWGGAVYTAAVVVTFKLVE